MRVAAGGVTIASADPANRAVIAGVEMSGCSGLRFENLEITINSRTQKAFLVGSSDHISLDHLNVHDGVGGDRRGIVIRDSSDVSVTNSDLHDMGGGVEAIDSRQVVVRGNQFHDLRGDGAGGTGSSNVTITGNHFTDFYPAPGDHPDAIQFFTLNQKAPVHDLTITDNTIVRGQGGPVQGVFLGNEIDMPYQQVTITGNTLIGTMFNGIAVGVGEHVLIANNVVQAYADMDSWIIIERNTDAKVTNNQASSFIFKGANEALILSGNAKLAAVDVSSPTRGVALDLSGVLYGTSGTDGLVGGRGDDQLWGGAGDDSIDGGEGANLLRGEEGDDTLAGGSSFDDLHGNVGNDNLHGGGGGDWVVGGQGNDTLFGDDGDDLVYGQLGQDTCEGGTGNDALAGGQAEDLLRGGAGDDYLSGDRGDDTMTGGAGADRFHTFAETASDLITDFNAAEGDRIQLDPGASYSVLQVGADTVISLSGGGRAVLAGVDLSSLQPGWIFGF